MEDTEVICSGLQLDKSHRVVYFEDFRRIMGVGHHNMLRQTSWVETTIKQNYRHSTPTIQEDLYF